LVFFHKTAKLKPTNTFSCGFRLLVDNLNHSTTEALNNNNISEANKLLYNLLFSVFIKVLLHNIGTHVDHIILIDKIKEGMEIEGLRDSLIKILQDYHLQVCYHSNFYRDDFSSVI
jgi:hypothetical protein